MRPSRMTCAPSLDLPRPLPDRCHLMVTDLREDPSVVCNSDEHRKVEQAALVFVFIWPVGMPLMFLALLLLSRRWPLLASGTAVLHQEYKEEFFWWEPIFMLQRLVICGFLQFIPAKNMRLSAAVVLTNVYLVALFIAMPFKQTALNILATISTQFMLSVVFFGALLLQMWGILHAMGGDELAGQSLGFSTEYDMVNFILVINFSVVGFFLLLEVFQIYQASRAAARKARAELEAAAARGRMSNPPTCRWELREGNKFIKCATRSLKPRVACAQR